MNLQKQKKVNFEDDLYKSRCSEMILPKIFVKNCNFYVDADVDCDTKLGIRVEKLRFYIFELQEPKNNKYAYLFSYFA